MWAHNKRLISKEPSWKILLKYWAFSIKKSKHLKITSQTVVWKLCLCPKWPVWVRRVYIIPWNFFFVPISNHGPNSRLPCYKKPGSQIDSDNALAQKSTGSLSELDFGATTGRRLGGLKQCQKKWRGMVSQSISSSSAQASAAQARHFEGGWQVPCPPDVVGLLWRPRRTLVELRLCACPLLLGYPPRRGQPVGQLLLSPCFHLVGLHLRTEFPFDLSYS